MEDRVILDGLLKGLRKIQYPGHPSNRVLRDYIEGRLEDKWRFSNKQVMVEFMRGELEDWKLSEVSLHVATCKRCSRKVARLRLRKLDRQERIRKWLVPLGLELNRAWGKKGSIYISPEPNFASLLNRQSPLYLHRYPLDYYYRLG